MLSEKIKKIAKDLYDPSEDMEDLVKEFIKNEGKNQVEFVKAIGDNLWGIEDYIVKNNLFKYDFMVSAYKKIMTTEGVKREMIGKLYNIIYSSGYDVKKSKVFEYLAKYLEKPTLKDFDKAWKDWINAAGEWDDDPKALDQMNDLIKKYIDPKGSELLIDKEEYEQYLELKKKYEK